MNRRWIFLGLGLGLARAMDGVRPETVAMTAIGGVVLGGLIIAGFYLV